MGLLNVSLFFIAVAIFRCAFVLLSKAKRQSDRLFPSFRYGTIPGLSSWIGAFRFMRDPANFLLAGYERHKNNTGPDSCFKLSDLYDEFIVICDKQKIRECYTAPQKVLSSFERNKENIQIKWIMGKEMHDNPFPIKVIGSKATLLITKGLDTAQHEVQRTLDERAGISNEWNTVTVWDVSAFSVARLSSVIFGGEELSRNIPYIEILSTFGRAFITSIQILRLCPGWSKDIVRPFMPSYLREQQARDLLAPYLQKRLDDFAHHKTRDDLLQALIADTPSSERDVPHLVQSLFAVNAAVQSATTFLVANALFMLTRDPERYLPELRAEAQSNLAGRSADKPALDKLDKLENFLRESARFNNAFLLTAERLVMEDFTFSDGTFVSKGTTLAVPQIAVHRDANNYPGPAIFNPERFIAAPTDKNEGSQERCGPATQLSDINDGNYLHFGNSRHSCPGRHFATLAAKLIVANIILRYDTQRLPNTPPADTFSYYGIFNKPDLKYQIMMKRRDDGI